MVLRAKTVEWLQPGVNPGFAMSVLVEGLDVELRRLSAVIPCVTRDDLGRSMSAGADFDCPGSSCSSCLKKGEDNDACRLPQ